MKPDPGAAPDSYTDRLARIALTRLAEPGNSSVWSLVQAHGTPAAVQRLLSGDVDDTALRTSVSLKTAGPDQLQLAETILLRAQRHGARLLVPGDPEWPHRLDDLAADAASGRLRRHAGPPLCLWVRGPLPLAETVHRSVAIVGARAATPYGVHVTSQIAAGLAAENYTVVSGGGFGVDAAAHRAALAVGRPTIAVLACGIDRPYPAGNTTMFDHITDTGLLVTEWPPGTEPVAHRFARRNHLIAAATTGTVLTEAALRSGSLQTVQTALSLGRPAMVVPGPVTSAVSAGNHQVLRSHPQAILVTGTRDVLDAIGPSAAEAPSA